MGKLSTLYESLKRLYVDWLHKKLNIGSICLLGNFMNYVRKETFRSIFVLSNLLVRQKKEKQNQYG